MAEKRFRLDSLLTHTRKAADERLLGEAARESCMVAARVLCDVVRTTLGPRGMSKILAEDARPLLISKDGYSVITGLVAEHPAARLIIELAKAHGNVHGDGVTSTLILTGELLEKAESLLHMGLHPVLIFDGFKKAMEISLALMNALSVSEDFFSSEEMRYAVARTSLKEYANEKLCRRIVEAVGHVKRANEDIDEYIAIKEVEGDRFEDTELIDGSVLFSLLPPGVPNRIEDAKIAIIKDPLTTERAELVTHVVLDPMQMAGFLREEEKLLSRMVSRIVEAGANVIICTKTIDSRALGLLARHGIMTIRLDRHEELNHISLATGANIVKSVWDLKKEDLGYAKLVEHRKIVEEDIIFFEGCKEARACTFFVRGGTKEIAAEHSRLIYAATHAVASVFDEPFVVAGGGAIETELSLRLRKEAQKETTKKQLPMLAFAEALEAIPRTLAENCGLDALDALAKLKAMHQDDPHVGICFKNGEALFANALKEGVIEPLSIKRQMLVGAVEAVELILLTDGILRDRERMKKVKEAERRRKLGLEAEEEIKEKEVFTRENLTKKFTYD
ncbi:MAG: thermosome subunit [Candidatus Alkanophagales archaeon]|nr:MAG: thermosome subunit [Candidatus Alkanophagales archaeon]